MQDMLKPRHVGAHHRILSCTTGGEVHEEDALCLSELVRDFLAQDNQTEGRSLENDSDSERDDSASECGDLAEATLSLRRVRNNLDPYRKQLLWHVSEAVEIFSLLRLNVTDFQRNVVAFLLEKGHNAAICKTKWDYSGGGVIPGNHEFIDVERGGSSTWQSRYLVENLRRRRDELKRTVRVVCDVAKQCFECTGRSVPPWRKTRFMQNKWLAPYRRIIQLPAEGEAIHGAKCRLVGFYDIVSSEARPIGVSVRTR
ncbi:hypothetical protein K1719_040309 [Acacia pycnantha]|nr:hypothetical protein K1719_040309 [Acacia pycnantha]